MIPDGISTLLLRNRRIIYLILFLMASGNLAGQNKFEINLWVDNDLFTFAKDEDRYYSSGIFASFRKPVDQKSGFFKALNFNEKTQNLIHAFTVRQLVYTADVLDYVDINMQDRPFAGILSFSYQISLHRKNNLIINFNQDIGLLGPSSGTSNVHTWWHKLLNLDDPTSWEFQIDNRFLLNSKLELIKSLTLIQNRVEIMYESHYEFGTVFNNTRHEGTMRIGLIEPLAVSGYRNGILGTVSEETSSKKIKELYIFFGLGTEYVFGNYTIEGEFPEKELAPANRIEKWILLTKSGFNIHWNKWDLGWHFFFNTRENTRAQNHRYGRVRVTRRF